MRLIICVFLVFCAVFTSRGQTDDQMLWTKVGVEGKIIKKLS